MGRAGRVGCWPRRGEDSITHSHDIPVVADLIRSAPSGLALTNERHLDAVTAAADALFAAFDTADILAELEADLAAEADAVPLLVHLAVKLAKSKHVVLALPEPAHVSVVFAVYKEHERIRTRAEHPHGENFLVRKIAQLQWLCAGAPHLTWDLTVVDDGCPAGSGRIAQDILDAQYAGDNARVLFLDSAIQDGLPVVQPLTSTADSQKGGSIAYGMWAAAQHERPHHVIAFTDADLSTHLGQLGLLLDGICLRGLDAAIGSRREPTSIVVKQGVRNVRGKLFIYLWKRIITNLGYIVDTQCGFKAFRAETVRAIVDGLMEKRFAFDIELLLKTELRRPRAIGKAPIAWIDSEAASTTRDIQPYLSMLQAMVGMYRKYLPADPDADAFAAFIESLTEDTWQRLVANVPPAIAGGEPADFGASAPVSADELRAALG